MITALPAQGPTWRVYALFAAQREAFEKADHKIRARSMRYWKSTGWRVTFDTIRDGALPAMVFTTTKTEARMKEWLAANIAYDHRLNHGWIDFESEEDALMCFLRWR